MFHTKRYCLRIKSEEAFAADHMQNDEQSKQMCFITENAEASYRKSVTHVPILDLCLHPKNCVKIKLYTYAKLRKKELKSSIIPSSVQINSSKSQGKLSAFMVTMLT
jgi:hypothetical protein